MQKELGYTRLGNEESPHALVFIHGATMTKGGMIPFAEAFPEYNCIVPDLYGHGDSGTTIPENLEGYADGVEKLLGQLKETGEITERITLLGYSMGGEIAYEIALRKNISLENIVILCSGADLAKQVPLINEVEKAGMEAFDVVAFFDHFFGAATTEEQRNSIFTALGSTKVADEICYQDLIIASRYDKLDRAEEISVPVMLVTGDGDEIVLPYCSINTKKAVKNSQLLVLPFRGHSVIFEETGLIAEKIKEFLTK